MMHKIKDEDLLANLQAKISCNLRATAVWDMFKTRGLKLPTADTFNKQI